MKMIYQFCGFSGSFGPSQSTIFVSAWAASAACSFSTSGAWVLLDSELLTSVLSLEDMIKNLVPKVCSLLLSVLPQVLSEQCLEKGRASDDIGTLDWALIFTI
jgi:hypothetical protein